jgi:hypothetical protein
MAAAASLSVEIMLRRVHYVRARSLTEQLAALRMLPTFVAAHPKARWGLLSMSTRHISMPHISTRHNSTPHFTNAYITSIQGVTVTSTAQVKLVVLDSIAFHYRTDASDAGRRTRELTATAAELMRLAGSAQLAVVIVNQVTTQVGADGGKLVPALGMTVCERNTFAAHDCYSMTCYSRHAIQWHAIQAVRQCTPIANVQHTFFVCELPVFLLYIA